MRFEILDQVGSLYDETGRVGCGRLLWTSEAWEQLLGRSTEGLADCTAPELRKLEQQVLFRRLTLLFGWSKEARKLAVCRVTG